MNAHPLVTELFEIAGRQRISISKISDASGLDRVNLHRRKRGATVPNVANLEAALNAIGYQLVILRKST